MKFIHFPYVAVSIVVLANIKVLKGMALFHLRINYVTALGLCTWLAPAFQIVCSMCIVFTWYLNPVQKPLTVHTFLKRGLLCCQSVNAFLSGNSLSSIVIPYALIHIWWYGSVLGLPSCSICICRKIKYERAHTSSPSIYGHEKREAKID